MATRAMTMELAKCDADLRKLWEQLHDSTWDPDELGCIRDEMDTLLERRLTLSSGTARGGHRR